MQAVIMAGGKGTRLNALTRDEIPKPMVLLKGKPILQWQVETLRENGITELMMVVGHLGSKIQKYFGDGSAFGVKVEYFQETTPLGSAGALAYLADWVKGTFFLVFGDLIFDVYLKRMLQFHKENQAVATIFVHPNSHPYDSDLVLVDKENRVYGFDSKSNHRTAWYENCVNAGFYILEPAICRRIAKGSTVDFEKQLLLPLIEEQAAVYAYRSTEYVKDVGTPDRIATATTEIERGIVAQRNLQNKQKCIFLDRDGTINREHGFIASPEGFDLEVNAAKALQKINSSGYLAIVVTNQPVVARGACQMEDVEEIHRKMQTLLGKEGAYVDDCLFCPHHPDKGFTGENPLYKVACSCRKPQIGMIEACVEKYNIDLTGSWMVGDTTVDLQTGKNAGLRTALVRTGLSGNDGKFQVSPDLIGKDLEAVVDFILE